MDTEAIEGVWQVCLSYHYDGFADVLYVARSDALDEEAYGDESEPGCHVMRSLADNRLTGVALVGYWRRYGSGSLTELPAADLRGKLEAHVSALAPRLAA